MKNLTVCFFGWGPFHKTPSFPQEYRKPPHNLFSSGKDEHCGANAGNNSNESLKS